MTPATLKEWRQAKGWSQCALARNLGVDQATISRWETGRSPVPRWVERLIALVAKVYG